MVATLRLKGGSCRKQSPVRALGAAADAAGSKPSEDAPAAERCRTAGQHLKGFAERLRASCCSLGNLVFVTGGMGLFILSSVSQKKRKEKKKKRGKKTPQLLSRGLTPLC